MPVRSRQPQRPPRLARTALTRGLTGVWNLAGGPRRVRDLITGKFATLSGTVDVSVTPEGLGVVGSGSTNFVDTGRTTAELNVDGDKARTVLIVTQWSNANSEGAMFALGAAGGDEFFYLRKNDATTGMRYETFSPATDDFTVPEAVDRLPIVAVVTKRPGVPGAAYINGRLRTAGTGEPVLATVGTGTFKIGGNDFHLSWNRPVLLACVWDRELSPSEVKAVSANPWSLFVAQNQPIFAAPASGGAALVGSAVTPAEASAGLVVRAALSGQGDTQSSAAASLGVQAALAAAADTASSAAAGLTTAAALAAQGETQCSATASLTTAVALAASGQTDTQASAALTTAVALAGQAVTPCEAAATLVTGNELAGQATTPAQASASLTTAAALAGQADTACEAAATLIGGNSLQAQAETSAAASAALTTAVALAGNADTAAQASAALVVRAVLAGTAETSVEAGASVQTAVGLAAQAIAEAQAEAALTTRVALAAIAQAQASSQAALVTGYAMLASTGSTPSAATAALTTASTSFQNHERVVFVAVRDRTVLVATRDRTIDIN